MQALNEEQIYAELKDILMDAFEIEESRISRQADLFRDLDLDSIDGVDLAVKLQELTGKRIKPDDFKKVRTVDDVIRTVRSLIVAA